MNGASTSDKANDFVGLRLPFTEMTGDAPFMRNKENGKYSYMGYPYRGRALPFKNDDPNYNQPQYRAQVHVEQLDTTNEEDMKRWTEIAQKVSDGLAFHSFEERVYDQELKGWRILIRWCEPYYTEPSEEPAI